MLAAAVERIVLLNNRDNIKLVHGSIEDVNENKRPIKGSLYGKIDGIVCILMALDRLLRNEGNGRSIYEERGVIAF